MLISIFCTIISMIVIWLVWLVWQAWQSTKGILRPLVDIKKGLSALLDRGLEDGFLVITPKGTKKIIQFSKYIINREKFGIELSFPNAEWSKDYYEQLKDYCGLANIDYRITKSVGEAKIEFLDIDCGKDVDMAYDLLTYLACEILELPEGTLYHALLHNAEL